MKKFLILALVLVISTGASALTIIQPMIASLNGQPITPVDTITIFPSDVINFDLVLYSDEGKTLLSLDAIVSISGPGTLTWDDLTYPTADPTMIAPPLTIEPGKAVEVGAGNFGGMGGIIIDHFLMHCDGPGTVIISVAPGAAHGGTYLLPDYSQPDAWGTATVIQEIPEPATLVLLSLCGLLLRRKK